MRSILCRGTGPSALAVVVVMVAAVWLVFAPVVQGSYPGRNGLIAVAGGGFEFGCRDWNINVMRPDGSGLRPLTRSGKCSGHERWGGDWSADGQRLLFEDWFQDGSLGLMSADASVLFHIPLPNPDPFVYREGHASLSPDARWAAWSSEMTAHESVWIAALDGTGARKVGRGIDPRWSPDGRRLAFTKRYGSRFGVLDIDTERTVIRRFGSKIESIDWSPDGSRLLIVTYNENAEHWGLATVPVPGTAGPPATIPLPRRFLAHWKPDRAVWSPDGRRIAFIAFHDVNCCEVARVSLWVMWARGGHLKRIELGSPSRATITSVGQLCHGNQSPETTPPARSANRAPFDESHAPAHSTGLPATVAVTAAFA